MSLTSPTFNLTSLPLVTVSRKRILVWWKMSIFWLHYLRVLVIKSPVAGKINFWESCFRQFQCWPTLLILHDLANYTASLEKVEHLVVRLVTGDWPDIYACLQSELDSSSRSHTMQSFFFKPQAKLTFFWNAIPNNIVGLNSLKGL